MNKEKVVFTGYIDNNSLYKYYQLADVMAVPSLWEEACSLTIIEGLTSGLPLIVTNSGGTPELVTQDSAIILVRDEYLIDNLALKINYLYNNEQKRLSMSEAAIKESKIFFRRKYYEEYVSIFQS
jgi:glycosyltransferase involved in cell wall biosynthesis